MYRQRNRDEPYDNSHTSQRRHFTPPSRFNNEVKSNMPNFTNVPLWWFLIKENVFPRSAFFTHCVSLTGWLLNQCHVSFWWINGVKNRVLHSLLTANVTDFVVCIGEKWIHWILNPIYMAKNNLKCISAQIGNYIWHKNKSNYFKQCIN